MFDIGWPELMLVMVVALIVIGPKDLPVAIRTVTTVLRKLRGMAAEFQSGLEEMAREAGVDEVKKSIEDVVTYDPKEALENIGALDDGEFSFDDDAEPESGNSILDPAKQSQAMVDDPEAANAAGEDQAMASASAEDEAVAASEPANEDEPSSRQTGSATSTS